MLSVHQSKFLPDDFCVHQIISIVDDIYNALDANPSLEVGGVFLDISKAFYRVRNKCLFYKLKYIGINGNFLTLGEFVLSNRYQCVVPNGQAYSLADVKVDVP